MNKRKPLYESLAAADSKAQYDDYVKIILSNKGVLARILQKTVEEYQEFTVEQIMRCIDSQIEMSCVYVHPGYGGREVSGSLEDLNIRGDRSEDKIPGEGMITYDIRLHSWIPGKAGEAAVKLLLNIEAQKSFYRKYSLTTRGIFYGARMISAQLDTEFADSDYNNIKKVYSIWICMNAPKKIGNAMTEYRIAKNDLIGHIPEKKNYYDKLSVIMVCLNDKLQAEKKGLHCLLNTLLSPDMPVEEKKRILEEEFQMKLENELEKAVNEMCNLSEAIEERGISKGINKGISRVVSVLVKTCKEFGMSKEMTSKKVKVELSLSQKKAAAYVNKYW